MSEQTSATKHWVQIFAAIITATATIAAALIAVRAKQEKTDHEKQIVELTKNFDELQTAKQGILGTQNAPANVDALNELRKVKQENVDLENRNNSLSNSVDELQKKIEACQSTGCPDAKLQPKPPIEIHLPPKDSARTAGVATLAYNAAEVTSLALYKCRKDGGFIVCYFVLTRVNGGSREYDTTLPFLFLSKLIDKFNNDHQLVREYFVDGHGNQQKHVNLAKDETSWYAQEFSGSQPDITAGRIAFRFGNIAAPVE